MLQWAMDFIKCMKQQGLIAAHRGHRAIAPENTMLAFHRSQGACDFVELDVQLSRDGVPMVIHDETLERTSNVAEMQPFCDRAPWRVQAFTSEELHTLDSGSWFYRDDPFDMIAQEHSEVDLPTPQHIPTLKEVLTWAKEEGVLVNVELKDMHETWEDGQVIQAIAEVIKASDAERLILFSSFYHPYLTQLKGIFPQIPAAALQEDAHPEHLVEYLKTLGVEGYHMEDAMATDTVIQCLRRAGIFVGVYTVNDPQRQKMLFQWGVNAIFTDFL